MSRVVDGPDLRRRVRAEVHGFWYSVIGRSGVATRGFSPHTMPFAGLYRSDAYSVYQRFPADRYVVGKSLPRTAIREYTKSVEMLVYSLAPVCWGQRLKSIITVR